MHVIQHPNRFNNYIATVSIGLEHTKTWEKYILPSWVSYCERHGVGLVVFKEELIDKSHPKWKKSNWQRLLMGDQLKEIGAKNVCYLDTDILINPTAPNVFDYHDENRISVVSISNHSFDYSRILRKIAFFRNRYLSPKYPLDSALFISKEDYFEYHNLPIQEDLFCSGFFVFNVENFSDFMKECFFKYPRDVHTITNGGDEPIINYEFQSHGKINWIDYRFQALWVDEMADKYPFLYKEIDNQDLVRKCVQTTLSENYFLHFSGKWESGVYKDSGILSSEFLKELWDFHDYLKTPVTGKPVGPIYPE